MVEGGQLGPGASRHRHDAVTNHEVVDVGASGYHLSRELEPANGRPDSSL
jgi:hypothetical protein